VTQSTRFIGQSDTLASYRVNANGSLTLVGSPLSLGEGAGPSAVAVDPGGEWVYVANTFSNPNASTAGFSLHPSTGILTPIPGSPFRAGVSPLDVAVHDRLLTSDIAFSQTYFSRKPAVAGGTPPYSWSIATGTLPAGLALNSATGIISGTPTSQGTSTFTSRVADSAGQSATQEFTLQVLSGNLPAATATLPSSARAEGLNGAFYTTNVTASNVSSSSANLTFKFLGNNTDGTGGDERTYTLAAGRTQTFSDILGSVFGRISDYGAISVSSATL
jgi:hypothetical protein